MRARLARLLDYVPVTPGGVLVLALGAWGAWRYGIGHIDLLVLAVTGVALVAAAASLFLVVVVAIATARVLRGRDGPPLTLEAGRPAPTGFTVPDLWYLPFVAVQWTWDSPEADVTIRSDAGMLIEVASPRRRGTFDAVVRRVEVGDAFGLWRLVFRATERRGVRFVPGRGRLEQVPAVQGMAGGDAFSHPDGPPVGDRIDMRTYAPGDPIRYVLWKVFARSRELTVRSPEQALAPARQTVAYLVAGPADEPAAGAARVAVQTGALGGDWIFGADGTEATASSAVAAMELIVRSGGVAPGAGGEGIGGFLAQALRGPMRRAVVFVPARPGPWLDRVVAAAAGIGRGASLEFMVCTDDVDRSRPSLARRLLFVPGPPRESLEDLRRVVARLGALGGRVTLIDRSGGRVVPAAALVR